MAMATIIINSVSASSLSFRSQTASLLISSSSSQSKVIYVRNSLPLRLNCSSEQSRKDSEEDAEIKTLTSPSSSTISPSVIKSGISAYSWCAGLGALGFLETSYLTYLKFSNTSAFCPFGADDGGACGSVLNSSYSLVFGIPLSLIGMVAYGAVVVLSLQLDGKKLPLVIGETTARSILLVTTSSMAAASAYFLYILNTQFPQESCIYCLASALLSFCLFFTATKDSWSNEMQKAVTVQLCTAFLVVSALITSYNFTLPVSSSSADVINLPYFETNVTTESTPLSISLARHLHLIGAKLYGAFWCSHCQEQKEVFGKEAAKILDYVECFPDGYRKGTKMDKACTDVKIEGFPTWIINGQVLTGEQDFSQLATAAGIKLEDLGQPD